MTEESLLEYSAHEGKIIRRLILGVVIINLVATTAGGYFLIWRYEVKQYQAGTKLAKNEADLINLESQIRQLELSYSETLKKYEAENVRLTYGLESVRLLNEAHVRVRVRIKSDGFKVRGTTFSVTFVFENLGKYDIQPAITSLKLYDLKTNKPINIIDLRVNSGLKIAPGADVWMGASFSKAGIVKGSYEYALGYSATLLPEMRSYIESVTQSSGLEVSENVFKDAGTINGLLNVN